MKSTFCVITVCLITACGQQPKVERKPNGKVMQSHQATLKQSSESLLRHLEIDYKMTGKSESLQKIDSIACSSDGDLSEQIAVVAVNAFKANNARFIKATVSKKLLCIEQAFVMGMSEEISVLPRNERAGVLSKFQISVDKSLAELSQDERSHAKNLIRQINPQVFD